MLSVVCFMSALLNVVLLGCAVLKPLEKMLNDTIDYTRQRQIFGKSVLDHQVVHYRLAELQTEVEALRSMFYRAVRKFFLSSWYLFHFLVCLNSLLTRIQSLLTFVKL